ncbi:MAG: Sec-independent protein translocase protein TatB [Desulfobulbus sp.]|nr:Sec-independent protein translocase protein TatB [Desulfobulbus sp.]
MFDIGFSELMVIGVVALIVIGPERLPRVARTAGHLLGRARRYVNDVKADINREMQLEELKKLQAEFADSAKGIENSVRQEFDAARGEFETARSEVEARLQGPIGEIETLKQAAVAPAAADRSEKPEKPAA